MSALEGCGAHGYQSAILIWINGSPLRGH